MHARLQTVVLPFATTAAVVVSFWGIVATTLALKLAAAALGHASDALRSRGT